MNGHCLINFTTSVSKDENILASKSRSTFHDSDIGVAMITFSARSNPFAFV